MSTRSSNGAKAAAGFQRNGHYNRICATAVAPNLDNDTSVGPRVQVLWQRDGRVESYFTRDPRAAEQSECTATAPGGVQRHAPPLAECSGSEALLADIQTDMDFYQYRAGISEPVESSSSDDRSQRSS